MNYSVSVLTLYGETERQNKISKNLNSSGIDFEFFSVNKNDLICFPYAETGCTISHMLMTEEFIRTKKEFKVILEDDAKPTEKFKSTLDEIGEIYNDTEFDVLLLGYIRVDKKGDFSPLKERSDYYTSPNGSVAYIIAPHEIVAGTFGYIMSKAGALKLRECRKDYHIQADGWNLFMRSHGLKVLVLKEMVVVHDIEAESSIGEHSPMVH